MTTKFAQLVSEDKPENQTAVNISFVDVDGKATSIGGGMLKPAAAVAVPAADADNAALNSTLTAVIKALQDSGQMATA